LSNRDIQREIFSNSAADIIIAIAARVVFTGELRSAESLLVAIAGGIERASFR
jgi:hypothetical protein